jgi:mannose-6-phosphate isomerase-like protein (cupin superfamily)
MSNSLSSRAIGVDEAEARLPESQRERSIALFQHGTLTVKLYAPRGSDPQTPHTRDEIYVVIRGTGDFVCAGERRKFGPHDFLFVPAGMKHRFENFSDDLAVWVFFYGPEGGETNVPGA